MDQQKGKVEGGSHSRASAGDRVLASGGHTAPSSAPRRAVPAARERAVLIESLQ